MKIWGGSNLAAGSDSEMGSSLPWTTLRDIAEPIVRDAFLANMSQSLPANAGTRSGVLLVSQPGRYSGIQRHLSACGLEVFAVADCAEARKVLSMHYQIAAVFAPVLLPDGNFHHLVEMAAQRPNPVPVVVCIPELDGGWVDLLESGAFQVVSEHCELPEIRRVVNSIVGCRQYVIEATV